MPSYGRSLRARQAAAAKLTLASLPDDAFLQVVAACGLRYLNTPLQENTREYNLKTNLKAKTRQSGRLDIDFIFNPRGSERRPTQPATAQESVLSIELN